MEYGRLIRRAWDVVWRYKILWLFGIVVSFSNLDFAGIVCYSVE